MVSWIKSLFCNHQWKHVRSVQEVDYDIFQKRRVIVGVYDVYLCEKCLKKKKIRY